MSALSTSSLIAVIVTLAAAAITGASLTALTVMLAVFTAVEKALLPPLVLVLTLRPALPVVASQAR